MCVCVCVCVCVGGGGVQLEIKPDCINIARVECVMRESMKDD